MTPNTNRRFGIDVTWSQSQLIDELIVAGPEGAPMAVMSRADRAVAGHMVRSNMARIEAGNLILRTDADSAFPAHHAAIIYA